MEQLGRLLIIAGILIVAAGIVMTFGPGLPFRLGRLPLDFHYQRGNFSFYLPLGTSLLISILMTLIFSVFSRGR